MWKLRTNQQYKSCKCADDIEFSTNRNFYNTYIKNVVFSSVTAVKITFWYMYFFMPRPLVRIMPEVCIIVESPPNALIPNISNSCAEALSVSWLHR